MLSHYKLHYSDTNHVNQAQIRYDLTEFLQFVVALVGTVVHSTGFIDSVVKWNVGVALSHMTDPCAIQCTGNATKKVLSRTTQTSVM